MKLETPSQTVLIEYSLAPWSLRLRWWVLARFYSWCKSFEQMGVESPAQANPLWRKW